MRTTDYVPKLTRERTLERRKWAQRSRLGWPRVRGTRCSKRGLPVSARCCAPCWPTWYPWRTPSRIHRCLLHPWNGVITWRSEPDHTCTTQQTIHSYYWFYFLLTIEEMFMLKQYRICCYKTLLLYYTHCGQRNMPFHWQTMTSQTQLHRY